MSKKSRDGKGGGSRQAFDLYLRANNAEGKEAMQLFEKCFRLSPSLAEIYGM